MYRTIPLKKKPLNLVYNGNDVRMLDHSDNSVYFFTDPSPYQLGAFTSRLQYPLLITLPFWNASTTGEVLKDFAEISYAGTKEVQGVSCHIIRCARKIKRPDTNEELVTYVNYFIGGRDHICRGLQTDKRNLEIRIDEFNKPYAFSSFEVSIPENFEQKKINSRTPPDSKDLLGPGTEAPLFITSTGNFIDAGRAKGKVVLLDFWGTWCGPCKKGMPHIQALYDKYKDRGLVVIGISVADAPAAPELYMKNNHYTYGLVTKGENIAKQYKVNVFPTVYLIGKDNKVIFGEKGLRNEFEGDMSKMIEKALE